MIKIGDTSIEFSQLESNSFDNSMCLSIKKEHSSVSGRFVFVNENSPLDILLNFTRYPELAWKSDCENLVIKKKIENYQSVINISFFIDSAELDEYWEVNVVSGPRDQIEINHQALDNAFHAST